MAKAKPRITLERLKERLHYDPETGVFTWLAVPWPPGRFKAGAQAGRPHNRGYRTVTLDGKAHLLHRLAWMYVHGSIPEDCEVDHRDGDKTNNRISNLRLATRRQNQENFRKCRSDSSTSTGMQGVIKDKRAGGKFKWTAKIMTNGHRKTLGCFDTPEEAHEAYLKAKRELHEFCTI